MNKTAVFIIIVIILAGALFFIWYSTAAHNPPSPVQIPTGVILFYGQGCPNCKIVDDFIAQNKVEDKLAITHLQVFTEGALKPTELEANNQVIYTEVAKKCGADASQIEVPFLFDGVNKCYVGYPDVETFLKNAAGIK
jgi:hypothetical protein